MGLLNRKNNIILVTVVSVISFLIAIFSILIDGIYDHDISTYANRLKDVVLDSK